MPNLLCRRQAFPEFVIGESCIDEVAKAVMKRFESATDFSLEIRQILTQTYRPSRRDWIQQSVSRLFT